MASLPSIPGHSWGLLGRYWPRKSHPGACHPSAGPGGQAPHHRRRWWVSHPEVGATWQTPADLRGFPGPARSSASQGTPHRRLPARWGHVRPGMATESSAVIRPRVQLHGTRELSVTYEPEPSCLCPRRGSWMGLEDSRRPSEGTPASAQTSLCASCFPVPEFLCARSLQWLIRFPRRLREPGPAVLLEIKFGN